MSGVGILLLPPVLSKSPPGHLHQLGFAEPSAGDGFPLVNVTHPIRIISCNLQNGNLAWKAKPSQSRFV